MQVLTKAGTRIMVSAVDADGLSVDIKDTPSWSIASPDFTLDVADDGMSATVKPKGASSTGTVVVSSSGLTTTADLSFTNSDPVERVPVKLNLTFTDLEIGATTPDDPAAPGVPTGAIPGVPVASPTAAPTAPTAPGRAVIGTGEAAGTGG